jgi:hypothetical protein
MLPKPTNSYTTPLPDVVDSISELITGYKEKTTAKITATATKVQPVTPFLRLRYLLL